MSKSCVTKSIVELLSETLTLTCFTRLPMSSRRFASHPICSAWTRGAPCGAFARSRSTMTVSLAEEIGAFALCKSTAEIFLVVDRLLGTSALETLLGDLLTTVPRESLREAADLLANVGLKAQAKVIRAAARKARPAPPNFDQRWRTAERRSGVLRGYVKGRRLQ
jgi:hypothetical protein